MFAIRILALFVVSLSSAVVSAGDCNCPKCGCKVCVAEPEVKKEKKHCYCTDCKEICIPAARLPWQCCGTPKCAKVRTVKVLIKKEYECEKCGWKWTVKTVGSSCGNGCSNCNGDCVEAPAVVPESATPVAPVPEKAARLKAPTTSPAASQVEVPSVRIADFE